MTRQPKTPFVDSYRPRLRILIDPVYVQISNLSGSSTYRKYVTLVRELVKRGHYVFWCVPDSEYTPDEIESHPNVGVVRTSAVQDQFVVDGLFTDDFFNLFNRVAGKYHVDVVCTSRNSLAGYIKRLLEPPRFHDNDGNYTDKGYGVPVVLIEEFPQTPERQNSGEAYWLQQCLGYLSSDATIFLSGHNRSEVTKAMLPYLTNSMIQRFAERQAHVVPAGIECEQLDTIYDPNRWKVEDGFKVVSIGRIMGVSYVEYLPWFDYLFKSGLSDVQLTVSLSGALGGPMKKKLAGVGLDLSDSKVRILEMNNRANFIRQLRGYHAFIAPMSHLDHPTGILEAMYMGVPGVIPVSDYQQSFFPDYPFVIEPKDKAGFLSKLLWIRDNKQEAREMVLPWRDRIREHWNSKEQIVKTCDIIENAARSHINRFKTSNAVIQFCKELKGRSYEWADVVAYLQKQGYMGISIGDMKIRTTFTYARGAVHHSMGLAGYVDTCQGPIETFVRRDVFDKEYAPVAAPALKLTKDERLHAPISKKGTSNADQVRSARPVKKAGRTPQKA